MKKSSSKLRLFLTDVDGVLTDGSMYYTENGDEFKRFHTYDGMAFELLRKAGIKTGIITSENTQIVSMRAKKIKADYLYQGIGYSGKLEVALEICKLEGINLENVAYIGDDLNCISLLKEVGFSACPANATKEVKSIPGIVQLSTKGGSGAVREWVNILLSNESTYSIND
jgi:3-deoxy-D-manno-octulosonate 8-phosphate phosphatase (KDO 8-P phosphatase)